MAHLKTLLVERIGQLRQQLRPTLFWGIAIFLLAFALRHIYLMAFAKTPFFFHLFIDEEAYHTAAQAIARGDLYGRGVFYQDPLYPYLLGGIYALSDDSVYLGRFLNVLLGSAACVLLCRLGTRWFNRTIGIWSGFVMAIYWPLWVFSATLLKSSLEIFLLLGVLCLLERIRCGAVQEIQPTPHPLRNRIGLALTTGMVLGFAILTRGNFLLLLPVACLVMLLQGARTSMVSFTDFRQRLTHNSRFFWALVVGVALTVLPFSLKNLIRGRDLLLISSHSGLNFYIGNNPDATGEPHPPPNIRTIPQFEPVDSQGVAEQALGRPLKPSEVSDYWRDQAFHWIRTHPGHWARLSLKKLLLLANAEERGDNFSLYFFKSFIPVLSFSVIGYGVIFPLGLLGFFSSLALWPRLWPMQLTFISYVASLIATYICDRYRLPLVPLLIGWAVFACDLVWRAYATKRWTRLRRLAVILALLIGITYYPGIVRQSLSADLDKLAMIQFREGRIDDAAENYEQLAQRFPHDGVFLLRLAQMRKAQGRLEEVEPLLEKARRFPTSAVDALKWLAEAALENRRPDQALQLLTEALSQRPKDPALRLLMVRAYFETERLEQAEQVTRELLIDEPSDILALGALANIQARQQNYRAALISVESILRLDPSHPSALKNRPVLLKKLQDADQPKR